MVQLPSRRNRLILRHLYSCDGGSIWPMVKSWTIEEERQGMHQSLAAQLRATLNTVPAFTWYSVPSGALTFVNHRYADYLGLSNDHPLRFGVQTGVAWDTHLQLLHPDDHAPSRKVGEAILKTGSASETSF